MTVLYGIYFIMYLVVPIDLYESIKLSNPNVAKVIKKYIVWIILLSEFHIFARMAFITITDIAAVSKIASPDDNSDEWPGLILG